MKNHHRKVALQARISLILSLSLSLSLSLCPQLSPPEMALNKYFKLDQQSAQN